MNTGDLEGVTRLIIYGPYMIIWSKHDHIWSIHDHARDAFKVSRVHIDSSAKIHTPSCFRLIKATVSFFYHFETSHAVCSFPLTKFPFRTCFPTSRTSSDLPRRLPIFAFSYSSGQIFSKIFFQNIDFSLEIQHFQQTSQGPNFDPIGFYHTSRPSQLDISSPI